MTQDSLSKYGYNFQIKVITCLLTDSNFLKQTYDLLQPDYFESEANQWLVEQAYLYFSNYGTGPTLETYKVAIEKSGETDLLKKTIIEHLKEAWKFIEANDLASTKDATIEFCQNQKMKQAIIDSLPLLEQGKFDAIKLLIDDALKAGSDTDVGMDYKISVVQRYAESQRNTTPTPWDVINNYVDGGFGKGELIVLAAPPGIGKSWGLINVGAHAIKKGRNVAHFTLELSEEYVGLRYDSVLTGISNQNLKYQQEEVQEQMDALKGDLTVKYFPTKTASVTMLKSSIDKLILQDKKPDVVIVDYADILKGTNMMNKRTDEVLGDIYADLRGLAGEYGIPLYTASQIGRSGASDDVIEGDKISGSYEKLMIADFVISLSRKLTDKIAGTGRFFIIKNRFGPDGITLPSKLNLTNGRIEIFDQLSQGGVEVSTDMKDGNTLQRKLLGKKFKEMSGDFG